MIASRVINCFDDYKKELVYLSVLSFLFVCIVRYFSAAGECLYDTVEHIYASWLISEGKLPYKDFFEHHNPLFWYLFSPVAKFFYRNINVLYMARAIALIGHFVCMFIVYKLALLVYDKRSAVFSLLCLFALPMWKDILTFRPDIFMCLFYIMAIYWNIKYLKKQRLAYLVLAYCSLVVSFAFLQKIAFLGVGFVLGNIYFVIKKKVQMKDFFIAGFSALALLLLMVAFLWYKGILADWWYCNFEFNMLMKSYYGNYTSGVPYFLKPITLLVGVGVIRYFKYDDDILLVMISWVFAAISLIMFFPHVQYIYMYMYLAVIILGRKCANTEKNALLYITMTFFIFLNLLSIYPKEYQKNSAAKYVNTIRYVLDNGSSEDEVVMLNNLNFNLYQPLVDYHWLGVGNVVIVDLLNRDDKSFDLNEFIKEKKPKFLFGSELWNIIDTHSNWYFSFFHRRNFLIWQRAAKNPEYRSKIVKRDVDFWKIDKDYIEKNYRKVNNFDLWQRIKE